MFTRHSTLATVTGVNKIILDRAIDMQRITGKTFEQCVVSVIENDKKLYEKYLAEQALARTGKR